MQKIAIISTHPIQYNAPLFRLLAERKKIMLRVFYTWGQLKQDKKYDPGFGINVNWDIPLLEGYDYTFVKNISKKPGSHHFYGINNPSLIAQIEQWNPDAILVFGWSFKSHLRVMRYFKGKKKIIFRGDSNLLDEAVGFSLKKALRRVFLKWVFWHVGKALYVGTANKEYYKKHGLKSTQLVFAPHAIDNDRFTRYVGNIKREELGIPSNAIVFIFSGKFERKKNPQLLLDTFIQLDDTNAHLLMVGGGELELQLKEKTSQLPGEIGSRIHFLEFQNQLTIPEIYKMGDILVLPSQGPGETWGLAVNEAMACSKAVLVSDKCGCAIDLVENGKNGFIFKSKDGNELLEKMRTFLLNKKAITSMGVQSLEIVQSWSFENICMAVEQSVE